MNVEQCIKCGTCEMVCPSQLSALRAIDQDRSHIVLMESVNCTTCNKCVASCPRGVEITKAIEKIRNNITTKGYRETLHNISTFNCSIVTDRTPVVVSRPAKYAYFAGCLTNYRQREIGDAVEATLAMLGIDYTRIREVCCGSPLNRIGRFDLARETLEKNLKMLRDLGVETVITSCPGCTSTFLEYQDEFEVMHYLDIYDQLNVHEMLKPEGLRATLQYPCHLYRNVSPYTMVVAERLLESMFDYTRLPDADRCCGAGGGVRRNDLQLSRSLKVKKVADIKAINPDIMASTCPQCNVQLSEDVGRVYDIAVLVARNLGLIQA